MPAGGGCSVQVIAAHASPSGHAAGLARVRIFHLSVFPGSFGRPGMSAGPRSVVLPGFLGPGFRQGDKTEKFPVGEKARFQRLNPKFMR